MKKLKAKIQCEIIYLTPPTPILCTLDDGKGNSVLRMKDFLKSKGKTPTARRLQMGK
jgi:hypothetical protein